MSGRQVAMRTTTLSKVQPPLFRFIWLFADVVCRTRLYDCSCASVANNRRREALCFQVVRPSVCCWSINTIALEATSLYLVKGFQRNLSKIFTMWRGIAESFSRSDVKGQGHSEVKCTFPTQGHPSTYGHPFVVRVRSRLTCLDFDLSC